MKSKILASTVLFAVASSSASQLAVASPTLDIVQTASEAGQFSTLLGLLRKAHLVGALKEPGPFTVFAPTDAAFAKLSPQVVEQVTNDAELLKKVLLYHVAKGQFSADRIFLRKEIASESGPIGCWAAATCTVAGRLALKVVNENSAAGAAQVVLEDIRATNGTIHVLSEVLVP